MAKSDYHPFVPGEGDSRIGDKSPREHAKARFRSERARGLFDSWKALFAQPFRGVTTDGAAIPGLYSVQPEGAPTVTVINAVNALLGQLTAAQKAKTVFPIDSDQWRNWQNTEIYVETHGLRLDEVPPTLRDSVMEVLQASLSPEGYEKSRNVMRLNGFLGQVVGGPNVLGEWSFIFCLFGTPSTGEPWGWQLFGHHLCLNCFMLGEQMVLSPTFMGAEPSYADTGPFAGVTLFEDEERVGLDLMRSLTGDQQAKAIVAHDMVGGDLPTGRRHFADGLHLGGAYQDNRVIPYEGLKGLDLAPAQRQTLIDLARSYMGPLPAGPLAARLEQIEQHLDDTHFCWIGGTAEDDAFYYRIQSPVVMIEFDHHSGVFLKNDEPAKFHVHTIVRTPNGNDYGLDLLRLHYENAAHHRHG